MIGRDRIDANIAQELSKQVEKDRLGRSELVLKKMGLLPPDFALKNFLLKSVGQHLAGYYDLRDKTMYLLNWVPLGVAAAGDGARAYPCPARPELRSVEASST